MIENGIHSLENLVNNRFTAAKTYLALGDSYTIGEAVPVEERFPVMTVKNLKKLQNGFSDPDIIATTGWTTTDLIKSLNNNPPRDKYTVVSLLIGVNNQYQGKLLSQYKSEFTELLKRAVFYADNKPRHVFVLSIPDYGVTPFAQESDTAKIAKEIDEFNAANKEICLHAGAHYLDITPISRLAKNDHSLTTTDGLHPSGLQYKKWAELLTPLISSEIE